MMEKNNFILRLKARQALAGHLSLIHISEPTRP